MKLKWQKKEAHHKQRRTKHNLFLAQIFIKLGYAKCKYQQWRCMCLYTYTRQYAPKQMFLANDKLFNAPLCCTTCKMWFGIYWNKEDIHWKGCYSQTKRHYVTDFQVTSSTNWHSTPRSQSGEPLPIFTFERVPLTHDSIV